MENSPTRYFKVSNFILILGSRKSLELMTTSVNIPGFNIGETSFGRLVVTDRRPGDHLVYNDLSVSFILDEKFEVYKEIYNYITLNANPKTGELTVNQSLFQAQLLLTTNKNNIQHKITFYDCWIKGLEDINLLSTTTEDEHINCTVNLVYNYHTFE